MNANPIAQDGLETPRNSPCPCRSGKRFKDCCGALNAASSALANHPYRAPAEEWPGMAEAERDILAGKMQQAMRDQAAGSLVAAARLYRMVLDAAPATHDALHMLGAIEYQLGRWRNAEQLIRRAMSLRPVYHDIQRNLDLVQNALRRDDWMQRQEEMAALALPHLRGFIQAPSDESSRSTEREDSHDAARDKASLAEVVGHVLDADDDAGWLAQRIAAALPQDRSRFRSLGSPSAGNTPASAGELHTPTGELADGRTLIIVGAAIQPAAWIFRARPHRIVVFVERGAASHYFNLLDELTANAGAPVEIVFRSADERARFGLPGRICVPPMIDLGPLSGAVHRGRQTDDAFIVGYVSDRAESVSPRSSADLWISLAAQGTKVLLRGANRLRQLLGTFSDIEIRSRHDEPLVDFLKRLDCLVYAPPTPWSEGCGTELFTAMALGVPVICGGRSTYLEYLQNGKNALFAANADEAVRMVCDLAANPELGRRIGDAGREAVAALFARDAIEARYAFLSPGQATG